MEEEGGDDSEMIDAMDGTQPAAHLLAALRSTFCHPWLLGLIEGP